MPALIDYKRQADRVAEKDTSILKTLKRAQKRAPPMPKCSLVHLLLSLRLAK
jgi:hypothetical protein